MKCFNKFFISKARNQWTCSRTSNQIDTAVLNKKLNGAITDTQNVIANAYIPKTFNTTSDRRPKNKQFTIDSIASSICVELATVAENILTSLYILSHAIIKFNKEIFPSLSGRNKVIKDLALSFCKDPLLSNASTASVLKGIVNDITFLSCRRLKRLMADSIHSFLVPAAPKLAERGNGPFK